MDYMKFLSHRISWIEPSPLAKVLGRISELSKAGFKVISLAAGDPDPDVVPRKILAEISSYVIENIPGSVLYTPTTGVEDLRIELSKFIKEYDGYEAYPENIIITSGSTAALDLLIRILIDPGDIVVVENPSYVVSLYAFKQLGANLVGVDVYSDGIDTYTLEDKIRRLKNEGKKIKLIYTIPTGQNPSGATMSIDKRRHLLEIASKYDLLIIEDMAYNYVVLEGSSPPTIKSFDREDRVIPIGTLSKIMGTGFRVGWVVATDLIKKYVVSEKQPIDYCAPAISQYIAIEFLRRGVHKISIERSREVYRVKRDVMIRSIEEKIREAEFSKPVAGMFLMLRLPNVDGTLFAENLMEKYKVAVLPGKPFYTDDKGRDVIRLNFSRPSIDDIKEAVDKIGVLYRELKS
jgi:2-aminoadipate transaminase